MNQFPFGMAFTSVQGHSHKKADPPIPCQDAGKGGFLHNGWPILIVSDGAGSSKHSHIASSYCVGALFNHLQQADLSPFNAIGSEAVDLESTKKSWHGFVLEQFRKTRNDLLEMAKINGYNPVELNCTLLLVIKTSWGFLSANIGDGRSGYSDGKPHALSVPFMTFTAGATFFLIKEGWDIIFQSYVTVPEHNDLVEYFFVSSDGCQNFLIDGTQKGPKTGIYDPILGEDAFYDFNVPYQPFFEGLIKSLKETKSMEECNSRLQKLVEFGLYLVDGTEKELKSLSDPILDDDKTFIVFYKK
jgi:hypothetical protein